MVLLLRIHSTSWTNNEAFIKSYLSNRSQVSMVYLTNRFHVAVRLFSNRSQMTSNVVRTKKWHTRRSTTIWRLLWSITESDARQHGIYLFYIITKSLFYFKIFQHNAKGCLLPRLWPAYVRKKAIWRDLWCNQNEAISLVVMRSKELWLVEKNRTTVKPDASVAPRWMKTYSASRTKE